MSIILVEKKEISDPMKWFADAMGFDGEWKKHPHLKGYELAVRNDIFYYCNTEKYYRFDDCSNYNFVYWDTKEWLTLAQNRELIYGHYSDDELSAEFLHIKDGKCIREFREYFDDEESNVDIGNVPQFGSWVDVASYVEHM